MLINTDEHEPHPDEQSGRARWSSSRNRQRRQRLRRRQGEEAERQAASASISPAFRKRVDATRDGLFARAGAPTDGSWIVKPYQEEKNLEF